MRTIKCKNCGSKVSDQYSCCTVCQTPFAPEPDYQGTEFKTSPVYLVALLIAGGLQLILQFFGAPLVLSQVVFFCSFFIILACYTHFTGKAVRVAKTQISSWRSFRLAIVAVVCLVIGYLLAGELGDLIGLIIAAGLSVWLQHTYNHSK